MPRVKVPLKAPQVKKLLNQPGRHAVGGWPPGLILEVGENGTGHWTYRTHIAGRRRWIGVGSYQDYTLGEAREKAAEFRDMIVKEGRDPIAERRECKEADTSKIFNQAWDEFWRDKAAERSLPTQLNWEASMKNYVLPVIGKKFIAEITNRDIERVLRPIWEGKTVTAKKIRGRLEDVFSWAIVKGYFKGDNPARWKDNLKEILPMPSRVHKTQHLRALDVNDAPEFMALLRTKQGTAPRALEFLILTAVRSLEVRGTRWAELDLERQRWELPGERMKMNRPHVVPLSDAALNLLQQTPEFSPEFVFPAPRGGMLSDMSLMAVIKRMDWYDRTTVHGFRAVFKSWANEIVDAPDFVSEMALAHSVGDSIQQAYKRSNLFAKRLKLMREWAQFLGYAEKGAKVVPLEARA